MQIIRDLGALRESVSRLKGQGREIALVPTMGALHDGHIALMREAARNDRAVIVSIFVNPLQFGPAEDFDAYPRDEAQDLSLLEAEGVAVAWLPDVATMYEQGHKTSIHVASLGDSLEGLVRPGHFDGVATVVAKLFNQVDPDIALFGEKDFQQLAVIRRMVRDLDLAVSIEAVATLRADDGLALSSRNAYLTADERTVAAALPRILNAAADAIRKGADLAITLAGAPPALIRAGFTSVDYFELCDASSLKPLLGLNRNARLLVAARLGTTRLIDNIAVDRAS